MDNYDNILGSLSSSVLVGTLDSSDIVGDIDNLNEGTLNGLVNNSVSLDGSITSADISTDDALLGGISSTGSIDGSLSGTLGLNGGVGFTSIVGGEDASFVFVQSIPSLIWNITHNLGKRPSITVVDSGDSVVTGDYQYIDNNTVRCIFSGEFSGKAYLN